jgi:hypothetical protein
MKLFSITTLVSLLLNCCTQTDKQIQVKLLQNYPSASGIEYFNNSFYIIGDDAKSLLILDEGMNFKDSIQLYDLNAYRFPKSTKPDLESITVFHTGNEYQLLIFGSGSLAPYRNGGWLIDIKTKTTDSFRLDSLFHSLVSSGGLPEVNIEGLCALENGILFVNRGHLAYPENNLLFVDSPNYSDLNNAVIHKIKLERRATDTSVFSGVSGLAYSAKTDRLFLTLSTELTESSYKDGAIGKSYLWIINDLSKKLNAQKLMADKIIDLEKTEGKFKDQKIESVCLIAERKNKIELAMVADNDNGTSTVFKCAFNTD